MSKNFNLYISYSWFYGDHYSKFISLLKSKPYFIFRTYSLEPDDPNLNKPYSPEMYTQIVNQIKPCHVVIILDGSYAMLGDWIRNEIKIAKEEFPTPKPIIVLEPRITGKGSFFVRESADAVVGWNPDVVIYTIKKYSL